MRGRFHILFDGQHGSSGKGAVAPRLAEMLGVNNVSSCNGPNAGHYVERDDNQRLLFKAIPASAALGWLGHAAQRPIRAWVGPNSCFEVSRLQSELRAINDWHHPFATMVHGRAAILGQHHRDAEAPGGALSTLAISSTMSGAGAAYAMKAMRQPTTRMAYELASDITSTDGQYPPPAVLDANEFYDALQARMSAFSEDFLHEVAQGFALSLDYGTQPRHCTYRNCSAQQAAADMGIRPHQVGNVYMNLRTFPIRVGNNYDADGKQVGYSGDWEPDQRETTWQEVGATAGMPQAAIDALSIHELTSVTKKLRRVATFSFNGAARAARFNGATHIVLNFVNYLDWSINGWRDGQIRFDQLSRPIREFVDKVEYSCGIPVIMLGTGPAHSDFIMTGH